MSMKCLRLMEFRETASIFHVIEENDTDEDEEDSDRDDAATSRVDLSEHWSLKSFVIGFRGYLS